MPTIYWAGDSTVKQNSIATWPQTGIGQEFHRFMHRDVRIENHAENGRSTKSFLEEGRLTRFEERMQPGDFLFIQFGHNDEKAEDSARYADPETDFPANLERFVRAARERGATPVIITPVTRFNRQGQGMLYSHDRWAEAARRTADRLKVAMVDLTALSEQLVDALGDSARTAFYMNLPAGVYPHFPQGQRDNTHLQPVGAVAFGGLIARALYQLGGEYAALLCPDFEQYIHEAVGMGCNRE